MERTLLVMLVVVTSAVVLALGGIIAHLAYRAYRRTRSPVLGIFAAGFAFVTLGLLFGGGLHHLLGTSILAGVLVQRVLTAVGFGLLVHSLYAHLPDERVAAR